MALSAQHIVTFTRHSVSAPSQLCWTVLRGGLSRLLPALFALWTRLPELLHILTRKVRMLENQSLYIGLEKNVENDASDIALQTLSDDECKVTCEVLYTPSEDREMDIIFIHGLHGSTVKTWRQGDWNTKYQEVQRIPLKSNNDASNAVNQGICPHCHLVKFQTRKSFSNIDDINGVRPNAPVRSYSVPCGVYTSSVTNSSKRMDTHDEEHAEESDESDEDRLTFVIDEYKEGKKCKVDNFDVEDMIVPINSESNLYLNIDRDGSYNNGMAFNSNFLEQKCDISLNKVGDDLVDKDSIAIDDCDITFFSDYLTQSVHNFRVLCDQCAKCQHNVESNSCGKCFKIRQLVIDNIRSGDTDKEDTLPSVNSEAISIGKRKFTNMDYDDVYDPPNLMHGNSKLRKLSTKNEVGEKNSYDEYFDIENELNESMDLNNGFLSFPNEDFISTSQQLSDNLNIPQNFIMSEIPISSVHSGIERDEKKENTFGKQFCTCYKNSRVDVVKLKLQEEQTDGSLSNCWPKDWLPLDYPNARVISLSYTTDQHLWRPIWIKPYCRSSLKDRSDEMVEKLAALEVGNKPIIWVGHSKGGLFIKEIFSGGYESLATGQKLMDIEKIYNNTKALVFYSVPHRGSPLANLTFPPLLRVSSELEEIQHESDFVLKLHKRFLSALENGEVDPAILSYCETRRTLMGAFYLTIVSTHSADPGVGHMYYGVSLDHREICKPTSRSCFIYKELLSIIEHIQKNIVKAIE